MGKRTYEKETQPTDDTSPDKRGAAAHPIEEEHRDEREDPIGICTTRGDLERVLVTKPNVCGQGMGQVIDLYSRLSVCRWLYH